MSVSSSAHSRPAPRHRPFCNRSAWCCFCTRWAFSTASSSSPVVTGAAGRRANSLALFGILAGVGVCVVQILVLGIGADYVGGMFAGALVSTAALQAALDVTGSENPSVGYGVSYPFGVIGPILCMYAATMLLKFVAAPRSHANQRVSELEVQHPTVAGRTIGEVATMLPLGVQIVAVRQNGVNKPAEPATRLNVGDDVLVVGSKEMIQEAQRIVGAAVPDTMLDDPQDYEYWRFYVSKRAMAGRTLGEIDVMGKLNSAVATIERGDVFIVPQPTARLELGDRVGLIIKRDRIPAARDFFGDTIKSTADINYVTLGIGMVIGVILGLISVPIPGLGNISLGLAGGPLIAALFFGYFGNFAGLDWNLPLSANLTLRNFRPHPVPRHGRHPLRADLCTCAAGPGLAAALRRCRDHARRRRHHHPRRSLSDEDAVRRTTRRHLGRHR
ncbi:hypothetical protein HC891_06485 [Candidatus Gracilibacteria bacterium]|nr:hypothetical protein [Candidatus Gracilibacteria bacterium]